MNHDDDALKKSGVVEAPIRERVGGQNHLSNVDMT